MTQVTKQQINRWGNYEDRKDNFDDDADYHCFLSHTKSNKELQKYLLQFLPKHGDCTWKLKPDGDYGIDVALIDKNTGKKLLCVDLERWSAWKNEWPSYYRYLHFLGRKDHFLEEPEQFLMVFFEYNRNKLIILDKETIKKYPTKRKWFAYKQLHDNVKEMKMSDGHIFGTNITERERKNFR